MAKLEVNYMRIGDKTFAIKEIQNQKIDINEELREMYKNRIDTYGEQFNEGVVQNLTEEWNTQFEHIDKLRQRGEVKVPQSKYNKLIIVKDNHVLECREIVYAPCQMLGSWSIFHGRRIRFNEEWTGKYNDLGIGEHDDLYIDIMPTIFLPLVIAYDAKASRLYTLDMRTFHSYSDGRICTGNHSAKDFWENEDFEDLMNHINWHSPASDIIKYKELRIKIEDLLSNETITGFRARGAETWRTN